MLSPLSDVAANITMAHCDAVGRGHPLHQFSVAINSIPKPLAIDAIPDFAHVFRLKRVELRRGEHAVAIKPLRHIRSDAGYVIQLDA